MGEIIVFDGSRRRSIYQETTLRKSVSFKGNQYTTARLVPAILSARTLTSAARRVGGSEIFLSELKRHFERRAA